MGQYNIIYLVCFFAFILIIITNPDIRVYANKLFNTHEGFTSDTVGYANLSDGGMTPWTIDGNTKIIVSDVVKSILSKINTQINTHYYLVDFDHVNQEVISDNIIRYTVDFFVHDTYVQITKRMIAIFTVNKQTLRANVEHINLSNAMKYPETAFPQYPTQDLIISDRAALQKYIISGVDDSTLDFSKFTPAHGPGLNTGMPPTEFNQWILPVGIQDAAYNMQSNFPCRNVTNFWDSNGVKVADNATAVCAGIKNTPQPIPVRPYENPTVNRQSTDRKLSPSAGWLFDATDNISGGLMRAGSGVGSGFR
jgi:hypothetical protein